jgi:hypothetical protein
MSVLPLEVSSSLSSGTFINSPPKVENIFADAVLKDQWVAGERHEFGEATGVLWKKDIKARWLGRSNDLGRKLSVLIHISSENPARGTEAVSAKIINSQAGQRNVFLIDGYIAIRILYWKGS